MNYVLYSVTQFSDIFLYSLNALEEMLRLDVSIQTIAIQNPISSSHKHTYVKVERQLIFSACV